MHNYIATVAIYLRRVKFNQVNRDKTQIMFQLKSAKWTLNPSFFLVFSLIIHRNVPECVTLNLIRIRVIFTLVKESSNETTTYIVFHLEN